MATTAGVPSTISLGTSSVATAPTGSPPVSTPATEPGWPPIVTGASGGGGGAPGFGVVAVTGVASAAVSLPGYHTGSNPAPANWSRYSPSLSPPTVKCPRRRSRRWRRRPPDRRPRRRSPGCLRRRSGWLRWTSRRGVDRRRSQVSRGSSPGAPSRPSELRSTTRASSLVLSITPPKARSRTNANTAAASRKPSSVKTHRAIRGRCRNTTDASSGGSAGPLAMPSVNAARPQLAHPRPPAAGGDAHGHRLARGDPHERRVEPERRAAPRGRPRTAARPPRRCRRCGRASRSSPGGRPR